MHRLLLCLLTAALPLHSQTNPDWTTPLAPFQIADNLYYVGSRDLAAYLVTTPAGNILINANLESSPPQIRASIEQLGFRYADTKILLNSQAHADHMGGAAQLLRETHARNMVMEGDAAVVTSGGHSDFMAGDPALQFYPPAPVDRMLHDGDTVSLGDPGNGGVTLTAHRTAGHTRGCTTWTLRVHVPGEPAGTLRNVVIVGGVAPWPQYRLTGRPGRPASYPGIAQDFAATFRTLRALPCDIFLGAHGGYFDLLPKLQRMSVEGPRVWLDPKGYGRFIAAAQADFEKVLRAGQ